MMSSPLSKVLETLDTEPLVDFTIMGQPHSKANSRRLASVRKKGGGRRIINIKSEEAESYGESFARQVPRLWPLLSGPLMAAIHINYASERPDLDESLILDLMQVRIYNNDRQVRAKIVTHGVNPESPSCRVRLWSIS
jgi:Holliday junction resolvase RusA-like endonuclease